MNLPQAKFKKNNLSLKQQMRGCPKRQPFCFNTHSSSIFFFLSSILNRKSEKNQQIKITLLLHNPEQTFVSLLSDYCLTLKRYRYETYKVTSYTNICIGICNFKCPSWYWHNHATRSTGNQFHNKWFCSVSGSAYIHNCFGSRCQSPRRSSYSRNYCLEYSNHRQLT